MLLRRIPDATDSEVEKAIADVANSKDVATKADLKTGLSELKAELIAQMYSMQNKMIMWMIGMGLAIIGAIKYL